MANNKAILASIIPQISWYGGRPLSGLLVGVPGVAKTQFLVGLIHELETILRRKKLIENHEKFELATYVLPQTSPDALEGISVPSNDRTELNRLPLADLRRVNNAKYSMVFGDELSSANPETGAAFMSLASDGRAGDLKLHDRVSRMFAMNPTHCAAAGRELSPPEANRFCWIEWDLPFADYEDYLRGGKGLLAHVKELPEDWEAAYGPRTKLLLAGFLATKRELMNELDTGTSADMHTAANKGVNPHAAWASQRSWENAMRLMAACMSTGENMRSELCALAVRGCVGENAANQFFNWLKEANIPDPEDLLAAGVKGAKKLMPKRHDYLKVTLEQLAHAACDKGIAERKNVDAMKRYLVAGEIINDVFENDNKKDVAYTGFQILAGNVPRQFTDAERATVTWASKMFDMRQGLGLGTR